MIEPVATKVHLLPPWHRRQQVDWIHINDHKARRSQKKRRKSKHLKCSVYNQQTPQGNILLWNSVFSFLR